MSTTTLPRPAQASLEKTPAEACLDAPQTGNAAPMPTVSLGGLLIYLLLGTFFGVVLVKSEVVSWFRIQEMFRFDSVHMYGVIGSALAVAALSLHVIKRLGLKTFDGRPIVVTPKQWGTSRIPGARYWIGGTLFGLGWGLLGACPGPMFALLGTGLSVIVVGIGSAMAGTWAYAALRDRLPH
ncbi:MAG: DUF6691 family protein [Bacteroidota bacterium]